MNQRNPANDGSDATFIAPALQILEALPIALFLFDSTGNLRYANKAGLKEFSTVLNRPLQLGEDLNDLLATIVGLAVYQDDRGNILEPRDAPVFEALRSGKEVRKIIRRQVHEIGDARWYVNLGVPICGEHGNIAWVISANIDITTQHNDTQDVATSIELLKSHTIHLQEALSQHEVQLNQSNTKLSSAQDDLQQFIHVASHDLKEPVRKIKTYTSRLQKELEGSIPASATHQLQRIDDAVNRLMQIIDGVMMYSGIDAFTPVFEPVDLNQVWGSVLYTFEELIAEKGIVIEVGDQPAVWGVKHLLEQLVTNLLSNALNFTHPDRATIIQVSTKMEIVEGSGFWVLAVADNGIGIAEAYHDEIFKPFTRLHSKDIYPGAGLGLSICQKIAAYHGGRIRVMANPQGGATFMVYLPQLG